MVLKRMNGIRRSYRFQRGSSVESDASTSMDTTAAPEGDVIISTEGIKVGWMLEQRPADDFTAISLPCTPCIQSPYPQYWTIGRVKFGVPLDQVCKNEDIPGPLLILILKLNKEGPSKKDVFRAPGHQASMKKLIQFLHNGRLVNIDNFSVYTIASVLKKFLRKLPDGIFGRSGEEDLFNMIELDDTEQQRDLVHKLITSRPVVTQHLLVLLFGTFRVIATNAERSKTGMTAEALGVSVAPSFFRSCVSQGKTASMDDVLRFKVATQIMKFMIENFGVSNLFGRENYEYYAKITGRILKVEEDWIFAFRYPPDTLVAPMAGQEESQSTPALIHIPGGASSMDDGTSQPSTSGAGASGACGEGGYLLHQECSTPLHQAGSMAVPENSLRESCTRLSISLEENGLYKVHERQTERMKTRSEWFLTPGECVQLSASQAVIQPQLIRQAAAAVVQHKDALHRKHGSDEGKLLRRSSSKDKDRRLVRRSSSKKDKENGQKKKDSLRVRSASAEVKPGSVATVVGGLGVMTASGVSGGNACGGAGGILQPCLPHNVMLGPTEMLTSQQQQLPRPLQQRQEVLLPSTSVVVVGSTPPSRRGGGSPPDARGLTERDCTETDVQRVHTSHTYKPRV